MVKYKTPG